MYLCMALVSLILGTIAVRAVVAFATWLLAGRALWLLPNALSDVRPSTQVASFEVVYAAQPSQTFASAAVVSSLPHQVDVRH